MDLRSFCDDRNINNSRMGVSFIPRRVTAYVVGDCGGTADSHCFPDEHVCSRPGLKQQCDMLCDSKQICGHDRVHDGRKRTLER